MALLKTYVGNYGQIGTVLKAMRDGQAPEKFTRQYLKDLGFASSNFHPMIPLLKGLGFLSDEGEPTQRYHDYRDESKSKTVLGQAIKEAYSDLFVIKANPVASDKPAIQGKFKSSFNSSDRVAELMSATFFSLLENATISVAPPAAPPSEKPKDLESAPFDRAEKERPRSGPLNLSYNIQIHLPATKDIEVYNAIFKSIKGHLIE